MSKMLIYNPEKQAPELVDAELAQEALRTGAAQALVNSPDGQQTPIDYAELGSYLKQGYTQPAAEEASKIGLEQQMQTGKEQLRTGVQEALGALSFGASKGIQRLIGDTPEEIAKRQELNPGSAVAGELAGLALGAPLGAAGQLGVAERLAVKALPTAEAATALGRVGTVATRMAIENAALGAFKEGGKLFAADPHQSVETALADIGLAGAIGGALGGFAKGTGELWNATAGKKVTEILNQFNQAASGTAKELTEQTGIQLTDEMAAALSGNQKATEIFQSLAQSPGKKGAAIRQQVIELQNAVANSAIETLGRTADDIPKLANISKATTGQEFKNQLSAVVKRDLEPIEQAYTKLESQFKNATISPETRTKMANEISQLIVDNGLLKGANDEALKLSQKVISDLNKQATAQDLRVYIKGLADSTPYGSEKYQIGKQLRSILGNGQDEVLDAAAGASSLAFEFRSTQAAYKNVKSLLEDLNDRLHLGRSAERGKESFLQALNKMDPETISKRLSIKDDTQLQGLLKEKFPELHQLVKKQELDNILEKSLNADKDALDIKKLQKQIIGLEPELRGELFTPEALKKIEILDKAIKDIPKNINPSGSARTMGDLYGAGAGSAFGIATGIMTGSPLTGVALGALSGYLGREVPDAIKLATLKVLGSNAAVDAKGFAGVAKLAGALIRGEQKTVKAAKAVVDGGKIVTAAEVDTAKIAKLVDQFAEKPEMLMDMPNDVSHYMPDHGSVISLAAARNLQYLASLKPVETISAPLGGKMVANREQEAEYQNALVIAQNPMVVLGRVQNGTLTPKDMKHLATMYPAQMQNMQQKLNDQLVRHLDMKGTIPYKTRFGLSMFMGQSLDPRVAPKNIISSNMAVMAQPRQQMQKPIRVSNGLNKLPKMMMNPIDVRQANKHK